MESGSWIMLKNCHLGAKWLATIEYLFDEVNISPTFRLWLTSEPNPDFSSAILRRSIKFSVEAPPGLNRAMTRISSLWDDSRKPEILKLSLLHAVIEERLNYGGVGWSKTYDFTKSDLRAGFKLRSVYKLILLFSAINQLFKLIVVHVVDIR